MWQLTSRTFPSTENNCHSSRMLRFLLLKRLCEFYSHLGKTHPLVWVQFSDGLVKQITASEATCDFQFVAHFWGVIIVATISRWWFYIFVLFTPNPWGKDPIWVYNTVDIFELCWFNHQLDKPPPTNDPSISHMHLSECYQCIPVCHLSVIPYSPIALDLCAAKWHCLGYHCSSSDFVPWQLKIWERFFFCAGRGV